MAESNLPRRAPTCQGCSCPTAIAELSSALAALAGQVALLSDHQRRLIAYVTALALRDRGEPPPDRPQLH